MLEKLNFQQHYSSIKWSLRNYPIIQTQTYFVQWCLIIQWKLIIYFRIFW